MSERDDVREALILGICEAIDPNWNKGAAIVERMSLDRAARVADALLASDALARIKAEAERLGAAAVAKQMLKQAPKTYASGYEQGAADVRARIEAVHYRRPHGRRPDGGFDFVAHGQTEFPDLCDHCRTPWPCKTGAALDGADQ